MPSGVKIVEDGVEESGSRSGGGRSPWGLLALALAVGVGFAVIFFDSTSPTPQPQTADVDLPAPEEEPAVEDTMAGEDTGPVEGRGLPAAPEGIGEVVPDFPDTLVAVTLGSSGSYAHLTWPVTGAPISFPIAGFPGGPSSFDRSGRQIAMGAPVLGEEGMLLGVGVPRRVHPLTTDVTGFAWHDGRPDELSYTTGANGSWSLWTVDSSLERELVGPVGANASVTVWGDWGWAVQEGDKLRLLTPSGESRTVIQGEALDSRPDGWILVIDDGLRLVSAGGGVKGVDVPLDQLGQVHGARISPDGAKVAVVGERGLAVAPLEGEGEVIQVSILSGSPRVAWTSDSRFVVSPSWRGMLVIDVENSAVFGGLGEDTVVAVATIPLSDQ